MSRLKAFDEDRALDLAVDQFWSGGYETTSVRDLANAMGIGGASLYNAYGDKRELFVRALERYANRSMRERVARIEARCKPKEAIGAFLTEIIDRSVKDADCKGCLLVNTALDVAPHDPEIDKLVAGYLSEIQSFFKRNLESARRASQVPKGIDPEALSAHLLGIVLGVRVLARTSLKRASAKRKLLESVVLPALVLLKLPPRVALD